VITSERNWNLPSLGISASDARHSSTSSSGETGFFDLANRRIAPLCEWFELNLPIVMYLVSETLELADKTRFD